MSRPLSYEESLIEFLSKPENLDVALEIGEQINEVKSRLVLRFWKAVFDRIQQSVSAFPNWVLELSEDDNLFSGNEGISLIPKDNTQLAKNCYTFQLLNGGTQDLFLGLWQYKEELPSPEPAAVRDLLDCETLASWTKKKRSFIWRYIGISLSEKKSLIKLAEGDELQERVADLFIDLFNETRELVEAANKALQR